jgi:uncharacterized protein YcfJ
MKTIAKSMLAAALILAAGATLAQQPLQMSHEDRAQVISVRLYQDASKSDVTTRERQECWNERTRTYESGYYRDRDGRLYRGDISITANGVLIGAALTSGAAGNERQFRGNDGVVRRCRTITTTITRPSDRDFLVTYRYAGQTYTTRTEHRPGQWMPVIVNVQTKDPAVNRR